MIRGNTRLLPATSGFFWGYIWASGETGFWGNFGLGGNRLLGQLKRTPSYSNTSVNLLWIIWSPGIPSGSGDNFPFLLEVGTTSLLFARQPWWGFARPPIGRFFRRFIFCGLLSTQASTPASPCHLKETSKLPTYHNHQFTKRNTSTKSPDVLNKPVKTSIFINLKSKIIQTIWSVEQTNCKIVHSNFDIIFATVDSSANFKSFLLSLCFYNLHVL